MASCVTMRRALSRCISPVRSVRTFNNWGETTTVMRVLPYVVSYPLLSLFLEDKAMIHGAPPSGKSRLYHSTFGARAPATGAPDALGRLAGAASDAAWRIISLTYPRCRRL